MPIYGDNLWVVNVVNNKIKLSLYKNLDDLT